MIETDNNARYTVQGRKVAEHWSRLAVTYEGALKTLKSKGINAEDVTVEDLHLLDMLHMGGLAATDEIAALAKVVSGHLVLDVGSGVGGPARRLAHKYGARVWGIELSERLYQTAVQFTDLVGMQEQVQFKLASALSLPFDDATFDVAAMQHVAMQISEKEQLFAELTRVVKPSGRLALHEIFAGEGELFYPLPWATEPSMSALETISDCSRRLAGGGFAVQDFVDHSEGGRRFHDNAIRNYDAALTRNEGTLGLSREAVEARRAASVAMEKNLRTGSLSVGMLVGQLSG